MDAAKSNGKGGGMENKVSHESKREEVEAEMKNKKTLAIVGIAAAVLVIVALAVLIFVLLHKPNAPAEPTVGGRGVVATPDNVEELREKANQPVEDGYYETRMNVDWEFPSASEPSTNAYVENSPNNKRTVYFDLTLADTKELVYSSPFIPVGAKLEKFALSTKLPKGEYTGIVTYHLVDDANQELTTVSVSVNLQIQK